MTERQAIKIRSIFSNKIPQEELYTQLTDELATELDNAIKKQIAQKPYHLLKNRYWGTAKGGYCPVCNSIVNSRENQYCRKCGQKLDWSDTE